MQRGSERTGTNINSVNPMLSRNGNGLLRWPVSSSLLPRPPSLLPTPTFVPIQATYPPAFYQYRFYMPNQTMNKAQELPNPTVPYERDEKNSSSLLKRPSTSNLDQLNSKISCADSSEFPTYDEIKRVLKRVRRWEKTDLGVRQSRERNPGLELTVMSYNILAQCLLEENYNLYRGCQTDPLQWDYRKGRLLREMQQLAADIICLQEVQQDHYDNFFTPELNQLGYSSVYKKRTGSKNDGCAIFFKRSKLKLTEAKMVEFCKPGVRLLDRDNVGMVVILQPVCDAYQGKLCVANTHLLFNPGRGDIKLAQSQILLAEIDRMAFYRLSQSGKPLYHPVIMCGDFNSEPHCYLYRLVSKGRLHYEGLIAGDISGQAEGSYRGRFQLAKDIFPADLEISSNCQYFGTVRERHGSPSDGNLINEPPSGEISHRLNFISAYKHITDRSRNYQPEVTTKQSRSGCTVDYIFYSVQHKKSVLRDHQVVHKDLKENSLKLLATYRLLIDSDLQRVGSLPNSAMPSDHLPLVARFLLKDH